MEDLLAQRPIGSHLALQTLCLRHSIEVACYRKISSQRPWIVRALAYRFFELYAYRREHDKFIQHFLQISISLRQRQNSLADHLNEPLFQEFSKTIKRARNFDPIAQLLKTSATDDFVCAFIRMLAIKANPSSPNMQDLTDLQKELPKAALLEILSVLNAKVHIYQQKSIQIHQVSLSKLEFIVQVVHLGDEILLLDNAFLGRKSLQNRIEIQRTFARNCQESAQKQAKPEPNRRARRYQIVGNTGKVDQPKKRNLLYDLKSLQSEPQHHPNTSSQSDAYHRPALHLPQQSKTEIQFRQVSRPRSIKDQLQSISIKALRKDQIGKNSNPAENKRDRERSKEGEKRGKLDLQSYGMTGELGKIREDQKNSLTNKQPEVKLNIQTKNKEQKTKALLQKYENKFKSYQSTSKEQPPSSPPPIPLDQRLHSPQTKSPGPNHNILSSQSKTVERRISVINQDRPAQSNLKDSLKVTGKDDLQGRDERRLSNMLNSSGSASKGFTRKIVTLDSFSGQKRPDSQPAAANSAAQTPKAQNKYQPKKNQNKYESRNEGKNDSAYHNKFQPSKFQNKFQPGKNEPNKFQPSKYQPSKYQASKFQPSKLEQSRLEQSRLQHNKFQSSKYQQGKFQPSKFQPNKKQPGNYQAKLYNSKHKTQGQIGRGSFANTSLSPKYQGRTQNKLAQSKMAESKVDSRLQSRPQSKYQSKYDVKYESRLQNKPQTKIQSKYQHKFQPKAQRKYQSRHPNDKLQLKKQQNKYQPKKQLDFKRDVTNYQKLDSSKYQPKKYQLSTKQRKPQDKLDLKKISAQMQNKYFRAQVKTQNKPQFKPHNDHDLKPIDKQLNDISRKYSSYAQKFQLQRQQNMTASAPAPTAETLPAQSSFREHTPQEPAHSPSNLKVNNYTSYRYDKEKQLREKKEQPKINQRITTDSRRPSPSAMTRVTGTRDDKEDKKIDLSSPKSPAKCKSCSKPVQKAGLYCQACTTTQRKECKICKKRNIPFFKQGNTCINCENQEQAVKPKPKDWKSYLGGTRKETVNEDEQQKLVQQNIKEIKEKYQSFKPKVEKGSISSNNTTGQGRGRETFDLSQNPHPNLQKQLLKQPSPRQPRNRLNPNEKPIRVEFNFKDRDRASFQKTYQSQPPSPAARPSPSPRDNIIGMDQTNTHWGRNVGRKEWVSPGRSYRPQQSSKSPSPQPQELGTRQDRWCSSRQRFATRPQIDLKALKSTSPKPNDYYNNQPTTTYPQRQSSHLPNSRPIVQRYQPRIKPTYESPLPDKNPAYNKQFSPRESPRESPRQSPRESHREELYSRSSKNNFNLRGIRSEPRDRSSYPVDEYYQQRADGAPSTAPPRVYQSYASSNKLRGQQSYRRPGYQAQPASDRKSIYYEQEHSGSSHSSYKLNRMVSQRNIPRGQQPQTQTSPMRYYERYLRRKNEPESRY